MTDVVTNGERSDVERLIDLIWRSYNANGLWPTWRDVDRVADREIHRDLIELSLELPRWWLWPDLSRQPVAYPQDTDVKLTLLSVDRVDGGRAIVELAAKVVHEIVAAADLFEPTTPGQDLVIASSDLATVMNLRPGQLTQLAVVGTFFSNNDLPGIWRGLGSAHEGWTLVVDERGVRRYRVVNSAESLLRLVAQMREEDEKALGRHLVSLDAFEPDSTEVSAGPAVGSGPELDVEPSAVGTSVTPVTPGSEREPDSSCVFLVHGRNMRAKRAMVDFLASIGLKALDLQRDLVTLTGSASPTTLETIVEGFKVARAVVVLFTPDEDSTLRAEFAETTEESATVAQARPNVYFEAGYAFHSHPKRTVLVELGRTRRLSDIADHLAVPMDDSEYSRELVVERLRIAGCKIILSDDWSKAGDFRGALLASEESANHPED